MWNRHAERYELRQETSYSRLWIKGVHVHLSSMAQGQQSNAELDVERGHEPLTSGHLRPRGVNVHRRRMAQGSEAELDVEQVMDSDSRPATATCNPKLYTRTYTGRGGVERWARATKEDKFDHRVKLQS